MPLVHHTYGKGRVRIMRVKRDHDRHEVRELNVKVLLTGGFHGSFESSDNSSVIATDTVKNIVNIVARQQVGLDSEPFAQALAAYFLDRYAHVEKVDVTASETKWARLTLDEAEHDHSFLLDANGRPFVKLSASRDAVTVQSGIEGFTLLKTTESGWVGYLMDDVTTIKETADRILATAMDATWTWSGTPADYPAANAAILKAMLKVFVGTYSYSVQNTMLQMGEAALAAVPEIAQVALACPNKHYLPINLEPFGLSSDKQVFTPTDEPHGQIECVIGR
ncbi:MAG TPA: urate oxidase [Xanthobacteraceae bacterium]|nr:urate oxidase [Xanthobacteraceae bacterium]